MGRRQVFRGNPEQKQYIIQENFIGGLNIIDADDVASDSEFRVAKNVSLEEQGVVSKRKGFSSFSLLNKILDDQTMETIVDDETVIVPSPVRLGDSMVEHSEYGVISVLIQNSGNFFDNLVSAQKDIERELSEQELSDALEKFRLRQMFNSSCKLLIGYTDATSVANATELKFEILTIEKDTNGVLLASTSKLAFIGNVPIDGAKDRFEIEYTTNFIYISSNSNKPMVFDIVNENIKYIDELVEDPDNAGEFVAYKPIPVEVRNIGFQVLDDNPLTYVDSSGGAVVSVQGIYLTDVTQTIPLLEIPGATKFRLFVIETGITSTDGSELEIKFFDFADDAEVPTEIPITTTFIEDNGGVLVYEIAFDNFDNTIAQYKIQVLGVGATYDFINYLDVYPLGKSAIDEEGAVSGLDLTGHHIIQINSRMIYFKGNEVWFSEINKFDYIPSYNFIILPLDADDSIVAIKFFRKSYIVFTEKRLYNAIPLGNGQVKIELVTDFVGCLAPQSVRSVNNSLIFLGTDGLYSLKSDTFREDLQNLAKIDTKIMGAYNLTKESYAVLQNEQYVLYDTGTSLRGYYNISLGKNRIPYTTDDYASDLPRVSTHRNSAYAYKFKDGKVDLFLFDTLYDDFGESYETRLKSVEANFGTPTHKKKFKDTFIKLRHGTQPSDLFIKVGIDGGVFVDTRKANVSINESGEVVYDLVDTSNLTIEGLTRLDEALLDEALLGDTLIQKVHRVSIGGKGKNIGIDISQNNKEGFSLLSFGVVFKLGKIKE